MLGDAHSLPSVWRWSEPYGRAVGFVSHIVRPKEWLTRGQSSVADEVSRYPITTKGVKKAINPVRFDDR